MGRTIIIIFLCTVVEGEIGKHSFISIKKTWLEAQSYCRLYYTDLSFVSSQSDQDMVVQAAGGQDPTGWIGLNRDPDNTTMAWEEALEHCRKNQSDLPSLLSETELLQRDQDMVVQAAGGQDPTGWIGLNRDPDNTTAWMWSGGGILTYQNWDSGQPNNGRETCVQLMSNRKWNDAGAAAYFPFYCININVISGKEPPKRNYCQN
uniref:C-type lectin domain-containing protein n=1 Tax=Mastacembelus armatus TaxID=205130 RepID=A0A7N8YIP1_9TELE